MVNFVEFLLALAAVCVVIALVLYLKRRRAQARRFALGGAVTGIIAIALELYLRI
jgi:hypothetical protein